MNNLVKVLLFGRKVVTAETLRWLVENPCVEVLGVVTDSHLEGSPTTRAAVQLGIKVLEHEAVKNNSPRECSFQTLVYQFCIGVSFQVQCCCPERREE